jgi:alkylation response protein AidB-like acyl-CoA dehydrogenase
MDFNYSAEQYMMQDAALALFREVAGPTVARRAYSEGSDVAKSLASRLAAQGMLGGAVAGEFGGSELSPLDVALVFEAAGQTLLPYPLMETYVAGALLSEFATHEQQQRYQPGIASGDHLVTVGWGSPGKTWGASGVQAITEEGKTRLYGQRAHVPFADAATLLLVPVESRTVVGTMLALVDPRRDGVRVHVQNSLDGSYPLCLVDFDGYELAVDDQIWGGREAWARALDLARAALAQEALGTAEEVFRQTVEYVKVREQFGFPVGRYQAVKHIAADDFLMVESARVANRYAAWQVAEKSPEATLYTMMAKAYASDMAKKVTGDAIQLHGGIGYTWDSDVHLYFKRAWRIASQLGTGASLREEMAQRVIDPRRVG